jgi:hypothetical protein
MASERAPVTRSMGRGRLVGSFAIRVARRDKSCDWRNIKESIEPSNVVSNCWSNELYDFANNAR